MLKNGTDNLKRRINSKKMTIYELVGLPPLPTRSSLHDRNLISCSNSYLTMLNLVLKTSVGVENLELKPYSSHV